MATRCSSLLHKLPSMHDLPYLFWIKSDKTLTLASHYHRQLVSTYYRNEGKKAGILLPRRPTTIPSHEISQQLNCDERTQRSNSPATPAKLLSFLFMSVKRHLSISHHNSYTTLKRPRIWHAITSSYGCFEISGSLN